MIIIKKHVDMHTWTSSKLTYRVSCSVINEKPHPLLYRKRLPCWRKSVKCGRL